MTIKYAQRMENLKDDIIGELLKLADKPEIISFAGGLPASELFPIEEIKKVNERLMEENPISALQYSAAEGYDPLRKHIVKMMENSGVSIEMDNVLITTGSQQGLEFSAKLLIDKGDVIITESPSYLGAINAFHAYEPKFIDIEMDAEGIRIDLVEEAIKKNNKVKFIYVIPDFQNPTGRTMSIERRAQLVALANKYNIPIVEDNPYGALRFEGAMCPAIKHFDTADMVVYLGTMSKTFCPGLRIGWIVASKEMIKSYSILKQGADLQSNGFSQRQASLFMDMFDMQAHIEKIKQTYKIRRDLMLDTMKKEFPSEITYTNPDGGLFTWVTLPEHMDAEHVFKKAIELNVAFVPGEPFYPNGGHKNHFRLNYSAMTEEKIVEGIKRLGKVLQNL